MAFVWLKDRVMEYSTTTGNGPYALSGAPDLSFNAFNAHMSIGDTTYGTVAEPGVAFKSGLLTYSAANQITVTTAYSSKGTFGSGIKEIFMGTPAPRDFERGVHGGDLNSAATLNLETATGDLVEINGTTTITAITLGDGHQRTVHFRGIQLLTNTSDLILPGDVSIVSADGDYAVFRGYAAGKVRCISYHRWAENGAERTVPSEPVTNIGTVASDYILITGTTTITSFASSFNKRKYVRFDDVLTITHNGTTLILPGGYNIRTSVGDTAIFVSDVFGNWRCYSYITSGAWSSVTGLGFASTGGAFTGTNTATTASMRYRLTGKTLQFHLFLAIDAGSTGGSGALLLTLPFATSSASGSQFIGGQNLTSGKALSGLVAQNDTSLTIVNYDATYPGAAGNIYRLSGSIEIA